MMSENKDAEAIRTEIFNLVDQYYELKHKGTPFVPGESHVPVSGKVFDSDDIKHVVDSALDAWFTTGRFNTQFEKELAKTIGVKKTLTVNSGSSANLLAVAALSDESWGDKRIKPGDEFITTPVSFPTTINPLLLYGLTPIFVDVHIPTYNIDVDQIEQAITPKTKAIVVAHTLGNPYQVDKIVAIAKKHNLWVIEDCCDALGATYKNQHVGTYGDIGTLSFYPAHHITMGEGGAVFTNNSKMATILESFRDWGRDCWCEPGKDNTCGKRFDWCLGGLPKGYDHKYIYSRIGYNLKITDMQAALGVSQLRKLSGFVAQRKKNFSRLKEGLKDLQNKIILPEATVDSDPSWFGFLITLKEEAGISRVDLVKQLTDKKVATRLLFAGDIRQQPYFKDIPHSNVGTLPNTEVVLNNTFWIGVTPMIDDQMVDYIVKSFHDIFNQK